MKLPDTGCDVQTWPTPPLVPKLPLVSADATFRVEPLAPSAWLLLKASARLALVKVSPAILPATVANAVDPVVPSYALVSAVAVTVSAFAVIVPVALTKLTQ